MIQKFFQVKTSLKLSIKSSNISLEFLKVYLRLLCSFLIISSKLFKNYYKFFNIFPKFLRNYFLYNISQKFSKNHCSPLLFLPIFYQFYINMFSKVFFKISLIIILLISLHEIYSKFIKNFTKSLGNSIENVLQFWQNLVKIFSELLPKFSVFGPLRTLSFSIFRYDIEQIHVSYSVGRLTLSYHLKPLKSQPRAFLFLKSKLFERIL